MAATYLTTNNSHGREVTAANPSFAHIRGWDVGVHVQANNKGTRFEIFMTGGSNGNSRDVLIGYVELTPNGPQFTQA